MTSPKVHGYTPVAPGRYVREGVGMLVHHSNSWWYGRPEGNTWTIGPYKTMRAAATALEKAPRPCEGDHSPSEVGENSSRSLDGALHYSRPK